MNPFHYLCAKCECAFHNLQFLRMNELANFASIYHFCVFYLLKMQSYAHFVYYFFGTYLQNAYFCTRFQTKPFTQ